MKLRDMAMMAMGGAVMLAYQKYNKPMMKAMKKTFNKSVNKMNKTLDDMM